MPDMQPQEQHPWLDKSPDEVLDALIYELYPPVSALGNEIDRLATGAFEDEELADLLVQLREGVNNLSRLVVMLKRYTKDRRGASSPPAPADEPAPDPGSA